MSKNPSVDIKTIYQIELVVAAVVSVIVIAANGNYLLHLFTTPKAPVPLKIREQQLKTAIQFIDGGNQN
jgi:hypothetical protein